MKRLLSVLAFVICFMAASPSQAQIFVVQNCGTVPASMKTLIPGAPGMFFEDTTGTLCVGGGGGGLSVVDGASWTAGTSPFTPTGGVFNDSATALSSGQQGSVRLNANREMHITCDAGNTLCTFLNNINTNVQASIPAGTNIIGKVGIDQTTPGTTNGVVVNNTVNAAITQLPDPCQSAALKTNFAIGSSSGNIQIVGGSTSKKVYLCSLSLIAAATAVVNVIEGTGAACTTANEVAVIGSTTAANGMSLAANGGLTLGNGAGTVAVTATASNGLCILQSGTTALAGNATYVQQ